jgi:hypothetical protein
LNLHRNWRLLLSPQARVKRSAAFLAEQAEVLVAEEASVVGQDQERSECRSLFLRSPKIT